MLLTSLLIDFSRIAAFRHMAELAVQSGARSVLSSFDPVLYENYGLFVRGGEDANELFRTAAEGYSAGGDSGGALPFLASEWTETDVTESRPLADHDVFRRQVLEEMKYKAPVDLALEFASRFRGVAPAMKEAAATVGLLERMRKAYDHREAALNEALKSQSSGGEQTVSILRSLAPYPSPDLNGSLPAGEVGNAADAALRYADYVAMRQEDEAAAREEAEKPGSVAEPKPKPNPGKHTAAIAAYESGTASLAAELAGAAARARAAAESSYHEAVEAWRRASAANEEMRKMAAEAAVSDTADGPASAVTDESQQESVDSGKVESVAEIRRTAQSLVLEEAFFDRYEAELSNQRDRGLQLVGAAETVSALLHNVPSSKGMEATLRQEVGRLLSALNGYAADYGANGLVLREREASFNLHRTGDAERKAFEKQAKAEWSGWNGLIGGFRKLQGTPEEREAFGKLDRLFRENSDRNRNAEEAATRAGDAEDPSEARDEALEKAGGLLEGLEGSLTGVRDSLFFSEYAQARMTRFEPAQAKRLLEGGSAGLSPDRQEEEYILYGFATPSGNLAAAYGEIFALRLAVRTMEGLIENRGLGHPLLILAAALAYGVRNAIADVRMLLDRNAVPLSKYLKAETTYEDYLRLFLITQGGGSAIALSRVIAAIEYRTGLNFAEAYTYASAEGTASLKLWFFPGLLKVLGRTGQLGGTVKGNRYEATYAADHSYQ
ncbi:hypothetical protein [Cohnella candidum]|nr:hypothetical protein [Cohnella candidum]